MRQLPLGVRLRDTARLESFVPGRNGEVVALVSGAGRRHAARAVALGPRAARARRHLLQAACAAVADRGGSASYLDPTAGAEPGWLEGCEKSRPRLPRRTWTPCARDAGVERGAVQAAHADCRTGPQGWCVAGERPPATPAVPAAGPALQAARGLGAPAARARRGRAGGGAAVARRATRARTVGGGRRLSRPPPAARHALAVRGARSARRGVARRPAAAHSAVPARRRSRISGVGDA